MNELKYHQRQKSILSLAGNTLVASETESESKALAAASTGNSTTTNSLAVLVSSEDESIAENTG